MPNNQWGTVTFQVPEALQSVQDKVNTTAEFLVAVLDVALTALELSKTFLVGYIDPIAALVQVIITEIESLISDMRQIGIYITGDWKLIEWPYQEIRGGFQEYQRRMISRLTDMTDPTRPDVSSNVKVLSMFFYLSSGTNDIQSVVAFVRQLTSFFGQSISGRGSLPVPVMGNVLYGPDAGMTNPKNTPEAFAKSSTPPSFAKIKWGMASTSQRNPFSPIPPLPPGGFIVTVSVLKDGLKVVYDSPQSNTPTQPTAADPAVQVQPREYGDVRIKDSGDQLVLFGGSDMMPSSNLVVNSSTIVNYNDTVGVAGATRIYAQKVTGDDGIIPLDDLSQSPVTKLLQRTFYVPTSDKWASWASGDHGFVLAAEDMPYNCSWEKDTTGKIKPINIERATTAYVRVASVGSTAYDKQIRYIIQSPNSRGGSPYVDAALDGLSSNDIGAWSAPVTVAFPGANTQMYMESIKTALLVLVLSRPDLKLYDPFIHPPEIQNGVLNGKIMMPHEVLSSCGLEGMAHLTDMVITDYQRSIQKKGGNPLDFRSMLASSIERVVHNIYNTTGQNPQVEKIVADQTKYLRTVTWGDIFLSAHPAGAPNLQLSVRNSTLWGSIQSTNEAGRNVRSGLAMNPYCIDIGEGEVSRWFYVRGAIQNRNPMMEVSLGGPDFSMSDVNFVPAAGVASFMATLNHGQQSFFEQFMQNDGSIVIPSEFQPLLKNLVDRVHIHGSADLSPVFYDNKDMLEVLSAKSGSYNSVNDGSVYYCRGLFTVANNGRVLQEAAVALSMAAAAIRRSSKVSAWIAVRAFDVFPAMDDFFVTLSGWVKSLQKSTKSIVDTVKRYIEFIEGRLVELQGLIRRINDLLQSVVGFTFQIPKCSYLTTVSDGTQGLVGDLVNSKNKPNDSPLDYGAGIAVVIPFGPAIAMDLIQALISAQSGSPSLGQTMSSMSNASLIGVEGLPSPAPVGDIPPDVL